MGESRGTEENEGLEGDDRDRKGLELVLVLVPLLVRRWSRVKKRARM